MADDSHPLPRGTGTTVYLGEYTRPAFHSLEHVPSHLMPAAGPGLSAPGCGAHLLTQWPSTSVPFENMDAVCVTLNIYV